MSTSEVDRKALADEIERLLKSASLPPWVAPEPKSGERHRGDIDSVCKGHPRKPVAKMLGQQDYAEREANTGLVCLLMSNLPTVLSALRQDAGAAMRERPESGQQAVAAMREKCAEWHEDRAAQHDASAQTEDELEAVRHHSRECRRHLEYAAELRSLPLQAETEGEAP